MPEQLPKRARCQNWNRGVRSNDEQIIIAGHEDVRPSRDRCCYNPSITRIADAQLARRCWFGNDRKGSEDRLDRVDPIGRYLELRRQDTPKFSEDHIADDQLVFGEDGPKHIGAKSPCRESGDEDIGVEADPHETVRNTSSSVR